MPPKANLKANLKVNLKADVNNQCNSIASTPANADTRRVTRRDRRIAFAAKAQEKRRTNEERLQKEMAETQIRQFNKQHERKLRKIESEKMQKGKREKSHGKVMKKGEKRKQQVKERSGNDAPTKSQVQGAQKMTEAEFKRWTAFKERMASEWEEDAKTWAQYKSIYGRIRRAETEEEKDAAEQDMKEWKRMQEEREWPGGRPLRYGPGDVRY
ncbi:hypothetical protein GQ43DRAFT_499266 [Delitschia confertaspora ATCC 74209]|uniref:Uncharacterized protein n=1 Tax=Delitschia confertaspora ATCC 74209 TaxID=1513339 RepID=A0A9P4JY36_9PLEO|nr:hypothetical protein GQ43DRAFT_499266 [Delitschia confertaspora ATCC 74209]